MRSWVWLLALGAGASGGCSLLDLDGLRAGTGGAASTPASDSGTGGDAPSASSGGAGAASSVGAGGAGVGAGGVGAAGAGAAGGSGAGPPVLHASDWTNGFTGVYRFDKAPPDLGWDDTPAANHLEEVNLPLLDTAAFIEGSGAFLAGPANSRGVGSSLVSASPAFFTAAGTSLTVGVWIRAEDPGSPTAVMDIIARAGAAGFAMSRNADGSLGCHSSPGDSEWSAVSTPAGVVAFGAWMHIVCRYDAGTSIRTAIVDGTPQADAGFDGFAVGDYPFGVPSNEPHYGITGRLDEAFVIHAALHDDSIRRIRACGIDGSLCTCDPVSVGGYQDCGRAAPNCSDLPPCNAPLQ